MTARARKSLARKLYVSTSICIVLVASPLFHRGDLQVVVSESPGLHQRQGPLCCGIV